MWSLFNIVTLAVAAVVTAVLVSVGEARAVSDYVSLNSPLRLVDTRPGASTFDGQYAGIGLRPAGSTMEVQVAGRAGVPLDALVAVLTVTAVDPQANAFLTVHPAGTGRPNASNVNYNAGHNAANTVLARIGAGGKVSIYSFAATHLIVDVSGYFPAGSDTSVQSPLRLVDTRPGAATSDGQDAGIGLRGSGSILAVQVAGRAGVPPDASTAVLTIAAVDPQANAFLTVYPNGTPLPNASNVNYNAGHNTANSVLARLGTDGKVSIYTHAPTDIIIDVSGHLPASVYTPLPAPARLADTRPGATTIDGQQAGTGVVLGGHSLQLHVAGRAGVPADASVAVLTVAAIDPQANAFLTVHPTGTARPNASNVNYNTGENKANTVLARLGAGGDVCIFTQANTHLIVDVAGYLTGPPPPAAGPICPVPPPPHPPPPPPVTMLPGTIYVATNGSDSAAGTLAAPYRTINKAVAAANSGDKVVLRGGVYRETVYIYGKAVKIESAPGERAVMEGARAVTGFAASGGDWYAGGWTKEFQTNTGPMVLPGKPAAGHPDQVFLNGTPQRQVLSRGDVVPGTFFHEKAANRLWIGSDPTGKLVEASDLSYALYLNKAHGSRLTNITVRRYGTEGRHMAAIRAYSDNIVVSGVKSELNAYSGMSAIGNGIVVRDSTFKDNGYIGLHGHLITTFVVERVSIFGNNKAGFDPHHSAAGMKVTNSTGITVRDSDVSRNDGPGIWTDLSVKYVSLVRNLTEYNSRSGIEIELSSSVNAVGNVAVGNGEAGIWVLESQDVHVFHNALYGNRREIWVEEGPRAEVQNVWIQNNILGLGRDGSPALLNVDDWTAERSAEQMNVNSDYNAFWLPASSPTNNISRWARWPQSLAYGSTLASHQQLTGQDTHSIWSTAPTNPYVRNAATSDYRAPAGTIIGAPVQAAMAWQVGVPEGTRLPIGPVAPVIDR